LVDHFVKSLLERMGVLASRSTQAVQMMKYTRETVAEPLPNFPSGPPTAF